MEEGGRGEGGWDRQRREGGIDRGRRVGSTEEGGRGVRKSANEWTSGGRLAHRWTQEEIACGLHGS